MTPTHHNPYTLMLSSAIVLSAMTSQFVAAQPIKYTIRELPPLSSPFTPDRSSNAVGMNELGDVVGVAEDENMSIHAVVWTHGGQIIDLDPTTRGFGKGINDLGQAVGWGVRPAPNGGSTSRPVMWDPAAQTSFDPALGIGFQGESWGINNKSQMAITMGSKIYFYDPITGLRSIGFPDHPVGYGQSAWEINNNGLVVGESRHADYILHAFKYDSNTNEIFELPSDPTKFRHTIAYGVNDTGDVVGYGDNIGAGKTTALLWTNDGRTIEFPSRDLRSDLWSSQAEHINNRGDVVGRDNSDAGLIGAAWVAFDAKGGRLERWLLSDLIDPVLSWDWELRYAFEINDNRQICGYGVYLGETRAFIMTPELSCYADCDQTTGVGVLDVFDFLCFQDSFVAGETYACDCDVSTGAGVCDVFDFLCFQSSFVGGCQ